MFNSRIIRQPRRFYGMNNSSIYVKLVLPLCCICLEAGIGPSWVDWLIANSRTPLSAQPARTLGPSLCIKKGMRFAPLANRTAPIERTAPQNC